MIQLRGAAVTDAELKGIRDRFVEVGVAARDAGAASAEGAAGAGGKGAGAAGFGAAAAKIAKVGAIALVATGLEAVKMSNTFQTEMLKIRTEGGATSKEFRTMRQDVLNLALSGQSFGQGPTSLAQGLYHLESMGVRGKKAILGLKLASAEAAISGSNLQDTTTSLGGALFIAAKGTGSLSQVMGTLNAIAGSGNMRFQELNDALGTGLLGSAKVAGISLQEMGAALAVLTDAGYKASSAGAQLGTALHYLYSPTNKAATALKNIGLSGHQLARDLHKPQGILAALRDLRGHMHGLSQIDQANVLNSILPGGRGRVLLNLFQMQNRLDPKYKQIQGTSGDFGKHMAEQALNPTTKMHIAVAKLQATMVILGDTLTKYVTPAFTFLVGILAKAVTGLLAAFNWFVKMSPAAKALATFIGLLTVAFVGWRIATTAATLAVALFNAVMDANPITLVIIALAALVAGIVYAYNKVGWFRDLVNSVWSWLKNAVVNVVNFVGKHWQLLGSILGGPFVALGIFIVTHFNAVKGVVIVILNFIIARVNNVIDVLNSMHISTPFGNIGVPHINHIGSIANGSTTTAKHSTPRLNHSTAGHQGVAATTRTTTAFAHTPAVALKDRPMMLTGDVILKVRGHELGRVTRRELHNAMTG